MKSQVYPLGKNAHEQSNRSGEEPRIKMALRQAGENPRSTQRVPTTKVNIERASPSGAQGAARADVFFVTAKIWRGNFFKTVFCACAC